MKRFLSSLDSRTDWLLPLSFTASGVANLIFFYLGLAMEENPAREYGFILVSCAVAVLIGLSFLQLLCKRAIAWKHLLLPGLVLLFFAVCYLLCFAKYGIGGTARSNAAQFIVFCIPAMLAGICTAARQNASALFAKLEQMTILVLPAALFYTNGCIFQCNPFNYGRDLGIIHYMSLAYTVMPFLLAHLIRFADGEPFYLPIVKRYARRPQIVRGLLIALYWYTILASGTRGTYVCVIGFCILLLFSRGIHSQPVKRTALTTFAVTGLLLFAMFVYTLPGLQAVSRMNLVVEGLKQGEFVTTNGEDETVSDHVDELVAADGDTQIANRPVEEPPVTDTPVTEPSTDEPISSEPSVETPPAVTSPSENPSTEEPSADIAEENLQISSRSTLYTLAWKEFLKSPLTGMGVMGYTMKYGMYPHNVILELLCETGIVGFIVLMGLILFAVIRLLIAGNRRRAVRYVLLFLMAYAIQANISGSLWNCPALLCALGYGLAMPLPKRGSSESITSAGSPAESV